MLAHRTHRRLDRTETAAKVVTSGSVTAAPPTDPAKCEPDHGRFALQ